MLEKTFLGLILFSILTGCNLSPVKKSPQSVDVKETKETKETREAREAIVPDELKEYAKNALDYDDYYMKEYVDYVKSNNEETSQFPLNIGAELIAEESGKSSKISDRLLPKLDQETAKIAKKCHLSLLHYSTSYVMLQSTVFLNALPFDESRSIEPKWKDVIKKREEIIKDCQLDS